MSEQNLIKRWSNFKQPVYNNLTCKICNHNDLINKFKIYKAQDIFHAGELIRYECPNCDVIFGDLRFLEMSKSEISEDYKDLYSYYKEGNTSSYILHVINKINLGKDKIYLDYACGNNSDTLNLLNTNNYNTYGYDAYVDNNHPKFINNMNDNNKFDIIYSNNYIEHVINPYEDLNKLLNLLNINGKLVLITSCWEYCYEITHYHTFFFLGRSIKYLCDKLNIKEIYSEKIIFEHDVFTIVKIFEKN